MTIPLNKASSSATSLPKIRVMVTMKNAGIRCYTSFFIGSEPNVDLKLSLCECSVILNCLGRHEVDLLIVDFDDLGADGFSSIADYLNIRPQLRVIVLTVSKDQEGELRARFRTVKNVDILTRPISVKETARCTEFQRKLLEKVHRLAPAWPTNFPECSSPARTPTHRSPCKSVGVLRGKAFRPEVLAVGSSTGGPSALFTFFEKLDRNIKLPILLTQHIMPHFSKELAHHLTLKTGWPCEVAQDGEIISGSKVYVAPGSRHMLVERRRGRNIIRLNDGPPENSCRPAIDPMLRSLVKAYNGKVLTVILTGMGFDGLMGGQEVVEAGGAILAQDQASSVVWGMPGAVAKAGLCSAIKPPAELAAEVFRMLRTKQAPIANDAREGSRLS